MACEEVDQLELGRRAHAVVKQPGEEGLQLAATEVRDDLVPLRRRLLVRARVRLRVSYDVDNVGEGVDVPPRTRGRGWA